MTRTAAERRGHRAKPRTAIPPGEPGADLWGRPPARLVECPGCGLLAEPYRGHFCWCCTHTGQADRILANPHLLMREAAAFLADPGADR